MTPKRLLSKPEISDWIDRAAVHIMQGLLASDTTGVFTMENAAKLAYEGARALWAERNKMEDQGAEQ